MLLFVFLLLPSDSLSLTFTILIMVGLGVYVQFGTLCVYRTWISIFLQVQRVFRHSFINYIFFYPFLLWNLNNANVSMLDIVLEVP